MKYAKAIFGALAAGLAALGTAASDGTITTGEWIGVASAVVAAAGVVYGVSNTPDGVIGVESSAGGDHVAE